MANHNRWSGQMSDMDPAENFDASVRAEEDRYADAFTLAEREDAELAQLLLAPFPAFSADAESMDMIRIVERGKPDPFVQVPQLVELIDSVIALLRRADLINSALWVEQEKNRILGLPPVGPVVLDPNF